jgi:hypothetical protein
MDLMTHVLSVLVGIEIKNPKAPAARRYWMARLFSECSALCVTQLIEARFLLVGQ